MNTTARVKEVLQKGVDENIKPDALVNRLRHAERRHEGSVMGFKVILTREACLIGLTRRQAERLCREVIG